MTETQSKNKISVGVIGTNPNAGWARLTHLPALKALPEFNLVAVSSRRQESANAAAKAFNAHSAFDNGTALIDAPGINLVVVSVKTPDHYALVKHALEKGKGVFCEWPLGANLTQAEELTHLAVSHRLFSTIGLQNRLVPGIAYARDLIRDERIGTPLTATLLSSLDEMGATRSTSLDYTVDRRNGANALTIQAGHVLDLLSFVVSPIVEVEGRVRTRFPETVIRETGEKLNVDSPDEVAITGALENGATLVAHIRSGVPAGTAFHFEVQGTKGTLVLAASGLPSFTGATVQLAEGDASDFTTLETPAHYRHAPEGLAPGPALAVAELYAALARAWPGKEAELPTFQDALRLHRVIDAIERASETGTRQFLRPAPIIQTSH